VSGRIRLFRRKLTAETLEAGSHVPQPFENRPRLAGYDPFGHKPKEAMGDYRLPYDSAASTQARAKVEDELATILDPDRLHEVQVMTSELVSNAIHHGSPEVDGRIVLEIEREPGLVRIIVRDGGRHMDLNEPTFHTNEDGHYGLFVVDTLADQWGYSLDGDKGVWLEVEVP